MLYDYTVKFETDIEVSAFSLAATNMFESLNAGFPVINETLRTTTVVTAGPLITDENKQKFCDAINQEFKGRLENQDFWKETNRKVKIGETRFVGYEKISEHL